MRVKLICGHSLLTSPIFFRILKVKTNDPLCLKEHLLGYVTDIVFPGFVNEELNHI